MISTSGERKYNSAHLRLLKPAIENFFETEFPSLFGPMTRSQIADALIELVDRTYPETTRIKPGQILWNALDVKTRGDSPNRKYKSVVLTIIDQHLIKDYADEVSIREIRQQTMARMIKEAFEQGAVLSTRDLSLLLVSCPSYLSKLRADYEYDNDITLPHTGVIHDAGTCTTHKKQIVYKHIVEKKDPKVIAAETNHSQKSVDRYLRDFNRIKTLYLEDKDSEFIHFSTAIARPVVKQYIYLIDKYVKQII